MIFFKDLRSKYYVKEHTCPHSNIINNVKALARIYVMQKKKAEAFGQFTFTALTDIVGVELCVGC